MGSLRSETILRISAITCAAAGQLTGADGRFSPFCA
jgi:hypothetical protein